jgi:hypothetical protein
VPLLGPTLSNRSDFIAANSAQASTPYEPLNIYWTCDVVTFRFVIDFKPQPVLGITILETVRAPRDCQFPFKIKQVCCCPNFRPTSGRELIDWCAADLRRAQQLGIPRRLGPVRTNAATPEKHDDQTWVGITILGSW